MLQQRRCTAAVLIHDWLLLLLMLLWQEQLGRRILHGTNAARCQDVWCSLMLLLLLLMMVRCTTAIR